MNYKNGRVSRSVPLAWRAAVTSHEEMIDREWRERGKDQIGKPWIDSKAWSVARVLDDHMGADGTCFVSYRTIAAHARMSRTSAKEGVARLVGAGLLERKQRRISPTHSDSNLYRALGVGPRRPGGGAATAQRWGRSGPQSPQEVDGSFQDPGQIIYAKQQPCAECGGPLGYLLEGDGPTVGAVCLRCFNAST